MTSQTLMVIQQLKGLYGIIIQYHALICLCMLIANVVCVLLSNYYNTTYIANESIICIHLHLEALHAYNAVISLTLSFSLSSKTINHYLFVLMTYNILINTRCNN